MKEKIRCYLKTFAGCVFGVFLGNCIYRFYDFKMYPDFYAMQSAPWYTSLIPSALIAAGLILLSLGISHILRKKGK